MKKKTRAVVRPNVREAQKHEAEVRLAAESPVITVREASALCHVPLNAVRGWIARGLLSYKQVGKCFLVKKAEVLEQLERDWRRGS
jgi:excisionase family DNA binding protein